MTLSRLYRLGKEQLSTLPGGEDNSPMEAAFLFEKALGLDWRERFRRGQEPAPEEGAARAELASTMEAIRRLVEAVKEGGAMTGRYLEGELESLDRLRQAQE